jgi:hypothetical protein
MDPSRRALVVVLAGLGVAALVAIAVYWFLTQTATA